MAMQPYTGASSSSMVSLKKYDVFISFRGEDTRTKFTSHLYVALSKKFPTFIDEKELKKGDGISSALMKAIEESYVSVVIFSEDYASSKWCLNELVKILECKRERGQIVIPVFYEVDPSHVRNQRGSYRQAFEKHERDLKHNKDKLQKWRNALRETANLSGWHFQNDRTESTFIKDIVEDVLKKLNRKLPFEVNKEIVGIEKKYEEIELLLKIGSTDVRTLGLWGMGGIGKTTLAKDLYVNMCSQFDLHCFIGNVREESIRCGLNVVRNKLLTTLLELKHYAPYVETPIFKRKLACEKSLIVLDDVATLEQAENLNNICLGPGSRVIVTTRDKQIFSNPLALKVLEMGRTIVNEASPKDPGRRSRLWNSEDVCDVLKYNKGTEVVEVISFNINTSKTEDLSLSSDSFRSMINLRYLYITYHVHFPKGLEWLSDKLRMANSKLRKLWDGVQNLDNLMMIDLEYSEDLIEIPDLSRAPNLQIVHLSCCWSLRQLHPSVLTRSKLRELDLSHCSKIKSLKTDIHSKSLKVLNLSNCYSLVEFSVTSEEMTWLSLKGTAVHEFPSWMWRNSKLIHLNLSECKKLKIVRKKLSTDLGLRSLTYLNLLGCTEISTLNLWFILDGMPSLKDLVLRRCCNLETLPNNIENNSLLEILNLDECSKLKSLPKLPTSLKQLTAVNCTYLDTNILHRFHFSKDSDTGFKKEYDPLKVCYLPGGQVPCEFDYQTTKASIDIPPIPKSGLCGFIFCIVLSKGLINFRQQRVDCTIYEHGKEILYLKELFVIHDTFGNGEAETLILDHVFLCSWSGDNYNLVNMGNESDHYNLSFEFNHLDPKGMYYHYGMEEWSSKGIKGCGVFPVYALKHNGVEIVELQSSAQFSHESDIDESEIDENVEDDSESDRVEIVELQFTSSAQVSDESDQHLKFDIDDSQNQSSTDENENEHQQINIPYYSI
ncbi:disease resistance protein RPV1 [Trifolium repens]|nr:disease resistance protein RPV1 [Trifolium repens]